MTRITDVLFRCEKCDYAYSAGQCTCDADYSDVEDDGRLRCPRCGGLVEQIGEG